MIGVQQLVRFLFNNSSINLGPFLKGILKADLWHYTHLCLFLFQAFHTAINSDIFEESDEFLLPPVAKRHNSKSFCNESQIHEDHPQTNIQDPAEDQYTFQQCYDQEIEEKENYRHTNQKTEQNMGSGIEDGRYHNRIQSNAAYRFTDDEFEYSERPAVRIPSSNQTDNARPGAPEYADHGFDSIPSHIKNLRKTLLQKIVHQDGKIPQHRESGYGWMKQNTHHRNVYLASGAFDDDQSTISSSDCYDRMVDENRPLYRYRYLLN